MSTKIHIVFVCTVGLHAASGDWRHRADRGCHIICVYIYSYCLCVLPQHLALHTMCATGNTKTHQWFVLQETRHQRNSVLTNSYSLVYILHFVSAVSP